jgi:two-component system chemotaxis sensor kinase CheA
MSRALTVFRDAGIEKQKSEQEQQHVVTQLADGLDRLSDGDLTSHITQPFAANYESLRATFNDTVEKLADLMRRVSESAGSVSTGATEIRAASDDLAQRNEQQAASLEETAAAMNQVTTLVKGTADSAGQVHKSIIEAHGEATEGGTVVKQAIEAMAAIERSAHEISQIINVIDGIAFQTNLLALNAGVEPLLMLRELAALGGQCRECDRSAVPPLDGFDPEQGYLGWTFSMPASASEEMVHEIFDFVGSDCGLAFGDVGIPPMQVQDEPAPVVAVAAPVEAGPAETAQPVPAAAASTAPSAPAQSIRIDLGKLDRLIDAVGELVIGQAMMAQRLEAHGMAASEELALLESLTRDIQESAMAIRAQPIGSVFSRVPRILRDLATSTGKHVRLETSGETTELDKTVVERLGEPLTHLIRNAVDHGIESAADRLAAGKPAEGTLQLSAEHRSGRILIRIADDGAGINRERVLAKAIEKGIVSPEAQLSREEIDNLIFAPGFSTAQTVSSVSGRGVGMDVVRQTVKDLGGRIIIESEPGQGTTFTMTLPLTLAISDGMIVTVGDEPMVVPLTHVVESLRPGPGEVHSLGLDRQMLEVRGKFIPIVPVGRSTGVAGGVSAPDQGVLIVVDTEAAGQAALLVDAIRDQRQFVIKNLDTHYRPVEGVAGATILGDGRVALIVDVDGLVAGTLAAPAKQAA